VEAGKHVIIAGVTVETVKTPAAGHK